MNEGLNNEVRKIRIFPEGTALFLMLLKLSQLVLNKKFIYHLQKMNSPKQQALQKEMVDLLKTLYIGLSVHIMRPLQSNHSPLFFSFK